MEKNAQISSQIFLYAFGVIIVVLIVFAGYKGMTSFAKSSEDSALREFESKINTDFQKLAVKTGSVADFTINVPLKYNTFCAFDTTNTSSILNSEPALNNPLIYDSLSSETENVFIFGLGEFYALKSDLIKFKVQNIDYVCKDINIGIFRLNVKSVIVNGKPSVEIQE